MAVLSRKQIDDFYTAEWGELISTEALYTLVESTCKAYHLNRPVIPSFVNKEKAFLKLQDLGQI